MNGATNKQLEQLNSVREALFSQVRSRLGVFQCFGAGSVLDPDYIRPVDPDPIRDPDPDPLGQK
jgi:hypothetical protein